MTGGNESAAGDKDVGPTLSAQVPVGWQRTVENGAVLYVSPSGTVLCSVEEVRGYLLTDSTCKCGLECPLVLQKVFNFDPAASVRAPSHESRKVEEDMTKLCNHRRKVVAMAALCRSMQTSPLPLPVESRDQRGSVMSRGDMVHCTYPTQPRVNQLRATSFLLQNGCVSHPASTLTPDQSPPLKKPPAQLPGPNMAAFGKQQWSPRPGVAQTVLQRAPHKPPSPSTARLDGPAHALQLDSAHPGSFSSHSLSSSPVIGRAAHPQGVTVKSPSPLSVCSSPSRALDSFSPPQRSRHSSTSSLSEGAPGSVLPLGVKRPSSPLPQPSCSPKPHPPPASPRARLEGILQHYKDCSSAPSASSAHHHTVLSNQSGPHGPQTPLAGQPSPCERRNGPSMGVLGLPLGQLLCQQKPQQQHISSSFPASSLLSAAAKAQLASQKGAEAAGVAPLAGLDKDQQSKVLISTLSTSLHGPPPRAPPLTAFLLPHSPSLPMTPPTLAEKTLRCKRQRRSPTVLSMLKESQMSRVVVEPPGAALAVPTPSSCSSPAPRLENHLQSVRLPATSAPGGVPRPPDLEDGKRAALGAALPLSSPPASSAQPLSTLLQLLSMQSAAQAQSAPCRPALALPPTLQYDGQPGPRVLAQTPSLESLAQSPQTHAVMCEDLHGGAVNLKTTTVASTAALNLSRPHATSAAGAEPAAGAESVLSSQGQLTSSPCLATPPAPEKRCESDHTYQPNQPSHSLPAHSPAVTEEQQEVTSGLLAGCDPEGGLALPPSTAPQPELPSPPGDPASALQLAESFPFMTQEQLLQLLSSTAGLPSLLPPFLGSLPLGLCAGGQPPAAGSTQAPQPASGLLGQASPLTLLPSSLGAQGDFPLNLVSLLSPPGPGPAVAPPPAPPPGLEACEKPPGLQALLMASLLLGQNPGAVLPFPGLTLELPPQQQVFGDGVSLEKSPALLDSVLMGPGLLEALQALVPPADGQSLLLSAQLTPPPPPAFLSLSPALLATALAQAETLPNHTPPPPPHSQGTLPSSALVSTSVSCASLVPVTGQEVCDPLAEQEKASTHTPQFLPPLLPPGVLGDLAALGNMNSLHSLLGAGSLLLPQASSLTLPLPQNQTALNPLTCLQLSMAPALMEEKPLALHETPPTQEDPLPPAHVHTPGLQRDESAGADAGLLDPYTSFMDTIYTSFLQVSGRGSEGPTPLSYPELPPLLQQASAPPSLSPRRACSVHNPDLSRLGMETAQSPARGTPKLTDNPSTPPPSRPARADACPADGPQLTFMEEAKTDSSAKLCIYSNGIGSGAVPGRDNDVEEEEEEEEGGQPLSPRATVNVEVEVGVGSSHTEQGRAAEMRTGARRGRKRKQTLQRGSEIPGDISSIIEEPSATTALPRPARTARGKRRRVVR